jgi:hypothetical protein
MVFSDLIELMDGNIWKYVDCSKSTILHAPLVVVIKSISI